MTALPPRQKVIPCLWFDKQGEEAARFYVSLLPDSRIDAVIESPGDYPDGKAGDVLLVEFTLAGNRYTALNGGPIFKFNEAVSLQIDCEDQDEVDRIWDALAADGGQPSRCGWIKDRWGLSWQIVPRRMLEMLASDDRAGAERAMQAMLQMSKLDVAVLEQAYEGR